MRKKLFLTIAITAGVTLVALLVLVYRQVVTTSAPLVFKSPIVATQDFGQRWLPDAGVTDHLGKPRQLEDFRGKVVLLFFGYTQCPDVCPTALYRATQVMGLLGPQADQVQILFMSLDPQRDTQELLANYVPAFDSRFIGLRPKPEAVSELAKQFRVLYRINPGSTPDTYTLDHGVTTYAYDPSGKLRLAIGHSTSAEDVTADIKTLLSQ
jgi:protein SCO1/2